MISLEAVNNRITVLVTVAVGCIKGICLGTVSIRLATDIVGIISIVGITCLVTVDIGFKIVEVILEGDCCIIVTGRDKSL
jgi:hypothetical protein